MPEISTNASENNLPEFATAFADQILSTETFGGDLTFVVKPQKIREMLRFLKTLPRCPFALLMDVFAMDYSKAKHETPERFAVLYNLYSIQANARVRLKVFLPEENPHIDSAHDLFASANWFEREAWDLFGVVFTGHPHLQRILCHNDFEGHPLRKDYPSDGYQRLKRASISTGI